MAHTPVGGNVILRVATPAVLEVEDDGPGIPHEDRERVFERFYRRNQQVAGSLGLAIVGKSVEPTWPISVCMMVRRAG